MTQHERLTMSRAKSVWIPPAGTVATYLGRNRKLSRTVRVVAEASAGRLVVEALGHQGVPVRITIKQENLKPLPPGLFD